METQSREEMYAQRIANRAVSLKEINRILQRTKVEGTKEFQFWKALKELSRLRMDDAEEAHTSVRMDMVLHDAELKNGEFGHFLVFQCFCGREPEDSFICLEDGYGDKWFLVEKEGEWVFENNTPD